MKQIQIRNLLTITLVLGLFVLNKTNAQKNDSNKPDRVILFPLEPI